MSGRQSEFLPVAKGMREAIPYTIARAGYLFPELNLEEVEGGIRIDHPTSISLEIRKELNYLLYREHIRQRFEPMRQNAYRRLFGQT